MNSDAEWHLSMPGTITITVSLWTVNLLQTDTGWETLADLSTIAVNQTVKCRNGNILCLIVWMTINTFILSLMNIIVAEAQKLD